MRHLEEVRGKWDVDVEELGAGAGSGKGSSAIERIGSAGLGSRVISWLLCRWSLRRPEWEKVI